MKSFIASGPGPPTCDLPVRNGMSSLRVLSTPKAKAMVDNFLMLFNLNCKLKKKQ